MYIGTTATYYTKFLYTQEMITGYLLPEGATRPILRKKIAIGEWNVQGNNQITIAHNLPIITNIISIQATIIRDDSLIIQTSTFAGAAAGDVDIQVACNQTTVNIGVLAGGFFDNTNYNGTASTIANRGWVYLEYEA